MIEQKIPVAIAEVIYGWFAGWMSWKTPDETPYDTFLTPRKKNLENVQEEFLK